MKRWLWLLAMVALSGRLGAEDDLFSQMKMSAGDARENAVEAVVHGRIPYALAAKAFLAAPIPLRVAWVKGVVAWARGYAASPEFVSRYRAWREENRPKPEAKLGSLAEEMAKQEKEFRQQVAEMRQGLAQMSGDMRKQMEAAVKEVEAQFEKQKKEMAAKQTEMNAAIQESNRQSDAAFQEKLKEFESAYPADPRPVIAGQIKRFLEISGSVDFAAKLEKRRDLLTFVNPDYEAKPEEWKLCFRAGRETVEAARAAVQAWLAELTRR